MPLRSLRMMLLAAPLKTRFQGKMTRISKDGGIEDMVKQTNKPINRVDKVTIRQLQVDDPPTSNTMGAPKITYGNPANVTQSSSNYQRFQQ